MPKLLRTLRLDPSDTFIFDHAAEPGEWAVPGSSLFCDMEPGELPPKVRTAFRSGFLGTDSLGFSTLVEVAEISEPAYRGLVLSFARRLSERFRAPADAAAATAAEEIAFAGSLCDHEPGTAIAMSRTVSQGAIREQFRTLHRRDGPGFTTDRLHAFARAFEFIEVDEPEEQVDLLKLTGKR
jgi:Family of unknown function (DUF6505)